MKEDYVLNVKENSSFKLSRALKLNQNSNKLNPGESEVCYCCFLCYLFYLKNIVVIYFDML